MTQEFKVDVSAVAYTAWYRRTFPDLTPVAAITGVVENPLYRPRSSNSSYFVPRNFVYGKTLSMYVQSTQNGLCNKGLAPSKDRIARAQT